MRPDQFFTEPEEDPLFGGVTGKRRFRSDLVRELRGGPVDEASDVEAAVGLARLVHDELEIFGTEGSVEMTEANMREALLALREVAGRLGIDDFNPEFRDFSSFKTYWLRNDAYGSWQARRDLLTDIFEPLHERLTDLETRSLSSTLAEAVSPHGKTGWSQVDAEISELRRHFAAARTAQDHRNIGNDCAILLEAVSRVAYDPERHLREGEEEPAVAQTKQRLSRVVEDRLADPGNAEMRKLARAAIEAAQAVKHNATPDRLSAGLAADAVILVANMLRRLSDP